MFGEEQKRWVTMTQRHWWVRGHQEIARDLIAATLSTADNQFRLLLDIGCSGGGNTEFLQRFGKVYGFDISFEGLQQIKNNNICVIQSDAMHVPFRDDLFDVVSLLEVAEHIKNDEELFKEIRRICKPGARVFVMVPAYRLLWGSHDVKYSHFRRYNKKQFVRLIKSCGFSIERLTFMHPHLLAPLFVLRLLDRFRRKEYGNRDDFLSLGPWIDRLLYSVLAIENRIIRRVTFPFGICIFSILKKV